MPTWSVNGIGGHTADIGEWWALVWRDDEGRWCWTVQIEREGTEDSADAAREAAERAATALAWVPVLDKDGNGTGVERALGKNGTLYEILSALDGGFRVFRPDMADADHPTAGAAKAACQAHARGTR